jgi:hypothetical protein
MYLCGTIYGAGLLIGGMCRVSKVLGFLSIGKSWDPTILYLFITAVIINLVCFHTI